MRRASREIVLRKLDTYDERQLSGNLMLVFCLGCSHLLLASLSLSHEGCRVNLVHVARILVKASSSPQGRRTPWTWRPSPGTKMLRFIKHERLRFSCICVGAFVSWRRCNLEARKEEAQANAIWGIACQNAAYLAAIRDLKLRFGATTGGRGANWEIAQLKSCGFACALGRPLRPSAKGFLKLQTKKSAPKI